MYQPPHARLPETPPQLLVPTVPFGSPARIPSGDTKPGLPQDPMVSAGHGEWLRTPVGGAIALMTEPVSASTHVRGGARIMDPASLCLELVGLSEARASERIRNSGFGFRVAAFGDS